MPKLGLERAARFGATRLDWGRMAYDTELLRAEHQQALVAFLQTELDLGRTFADIAKTSKDFNRRLKLLDQARIALDTFAHFHRRVEDAEKAEGLAAQAESLKHLLDRI